MQRDEVAISITMHELDFVSLVRAARLMGLPRDEVVRRAIAGYLVSLQKQGFDLGIVLPQEGEKEEEKAVVAEGGKDGQEADSA